MLPAPQDKLSPLRLPPAPFHAIFFPTDKSRCFITGNRDPSGGLRERSCWFCRVDKTTQTLSDAGNHAVKRGFPVERLGHAGRGRSMGGFVKIFTADKNIILSTAGHLCENKIRDAINTVIKIISSWIMPAPLQKKSQAVLYRLTLVAVVFLGPVFALVFAMIFLLLFTFD